MIERKTSLEKVLAILNLFSEDKLTWTADEVVAATGYSRPALYRYVKIMKDAGLLVADSRFGFTLGPRIVELDYLLRRSDPLMVHGVPEIDSLAKCCPGNALLVRWYGSKILCVYSAHSGEGINTSYHRGRPMPLARGAIGRSILAYLPKARLAKLVKSRVDEFAAVGFGATEDEIISNFSRIRNDGFAVAYGEVTPGVVGIAAPVLDAKRSPVASVCVTVLGSQLDAGQIEEISEKVRESAHNMHIRY
ncbi:IclR family transcriptional regulator [Pelagibacterium luteolum]|uniref:Transcriptional regulator, IclR family n=1 Tax=Pelagibacterium luteolum TaxID=440168 RepID=A0A1G7XCA4_9HYPH|nr:IclR family transcriptional regulator [Pelagibacterium luteolum]SDG81744.1 transcriptional regulator, IclR family [Pelagibacterium luteolum]